MGGGQETLGKTGKHTDYDGRRLQKDMYLLRYKKVEVDIYVLNFTSDNHKL